MTVTYWVCFFLGVGVLPLLVAFWFARQITGSDTGMPAMQQIAAAIKGGAEVFLKRQWTTLAAVLGLLLPTLAYGQGERQAGARPTWFCRICRP